jgi:hypothetical protein
MIHVIDTSIDIQGEWVQYEDFVERYPYTDLDIPGNEQVFLRFRILYAYTPRVINNKPRHRFAIEYIALGEWDYLPNLADVRMAYDYARQILNDNLMEWSGGQDALAEVVKPTQEAIYTLLQKND